MSKRKAALEPALELLIGLQFEDKPDERMSVSDIACGGKWGVKSPPKISAEEQNREKEQRML